MFVLDKEANKIIKVETKTFHDFGFKEREHLQEWIANYPECLGEKLLIIQKEFDGFNDTNERLDLLALDESGTIVVIKNKLDDTGRDVTWQALKYVSYCSTLSKQQIKEIYQAYLDKYSPNENAEENIIEFFNGKPFSEISLNENDQRMILVAGKFRKEVTSTVMWMLDHGIKVQCIKVTRPVRKELDGTTQPSSSTIKKQPGKDTAVKELVSKEVMGQVPHYRM